MPARFSNVGVTLLAPLAVAAIARCVERAHGTLRMAILVYLTLLAAAAGGLQLAVSGQAVANRLAFCLVGAAMAFALWTCRRERGTFAVLLLIAASLGAAFATNAPRSVQLARVGSFAAGGFSALVIVALASWTKLAGTPVVLARGFAALGAASLLASLAPFAADPASRNPSAITTPFDRQLKAWLDERGFQDQLILTPVNGRARLAAKIGQPVLLDVAVLYMMTYMPALTPRVNMMMTDLHGIDYSAPGRIPLAPNEKLPAESPRWTAAWPEWSVSHWQDLGRKYGFRFVLSEVRLQLPVALAGPEASLYEIPAGASGAAK